MTVDEKIELLMSAGHDAEEQLRHQDEGDEELAERLSELREHLDCLSCSTTLSDAVANVKAAIEVAGRIQDLSEVKSLLTEALQEVG